MDIIKEYCSAVSMYVIRINTYGHNLKFFQDIFAEVCRDFPGLCASDVEIVQYTGGRYAGTSGITFRAKGIVPAAYSRISELEYRH